MNDGQAILKIRDLVVSYGPVDAVAGIDIDVHHGEAVALLGANGAGKSSTLRAISRLHRSKGTIEFDGQQISQADAVARAGLVHVPEGRRLFRNLTTEENLLVGGTARSKRPTDFTLDDVYSLFPMLPRLRKRVAWALSGGEQQMVAIGRGLLAQPRLLLLDEPSLGLAPVVVNAVYDSLAEIRSRIPMLVVEQNASLALHLCDRAYVLAVGKVALEGPSAELAGHHDLLSLYLAREVDSGEPRAEGDHQHHEPPVLTVSAEDESGRPAGAVPPGGVHTEVGEA